MERTLSLTLCPQIAEAFDLEQARLSHSVHFWADLIATLETLLTSLNRRTRHGRFCAEVPSEHEFKIDYFGRELKLAIDHTDQRLYFYILAATGRQEGNREDQNPTEAGVLFLHHGPNGQVTANTSDIWSDLCPSTLPGPNTQQLAEHLLLKLTLPQWKDTPLSNAG